MPISVSCPTCAAKITAPDRAAGHTIRCPKCQARFAIPVQAVKPVEDNTGSGFAPAGQHPRKTSNDRVEPIEKRRQERSQQSGDESPVHRETEPFSSLDSGQAADVNSQRRSTSLPSRKTILVLVCLGIALVVLTSILLLEENQSPKPQIRNQDAGAAACASCCGGTILMFVTAIVLIFALVAGNVAILFWVAKDAKCRGMDGAMWIFLVMFTGFIGLAIYLFSRPQGMLVECEHCGNNRLEMAAKCPHCQHRTSGIVRRRKRRRDEDNEENDED